MKEVTLILLFLFAIGTVSNAAPPLEANDVSWLWPPPQVVGELDQSISMGSLSAKSDGTAIWSDTQFSDLLTAADDTIVEGHPIKLLPSMRSINVWRIAAFRIDPSAPGCGEEVRSKLGSTPQIRLIVQPVTTDNGTINVHDFAVHLVYDFSAGVGVTGQPIADRAKFLEIIHDLDELKAFSEAGGSPTIGLPLGVHPGLQAKVPELVKKVNEFLSRHLESRRLSAMALMGIEPPEPWIFVALAKIPPNSDHFVKVPFLPPQMISFRMKGGVVSPLIPTNNRSPISSNRNEPIKTRRGVSTAALFGGQAIKLDELATIGIDDQGKPIADTKVRNKEIPDLIAHPGLAHFFNTDCVSCHTETRRRMRLNLTPGELVFRQGGIIPPIASDVLPKDDWNVRNFGWFPPSIFLGGGPVVATVTQRTANETAEVVEFIERNYRSGQ